MRKLKTMDGNTAAAHVAYAFSEVSAIYPITPSSDMAENIDEWASEGRKNIFGEEVLVVEMQSEGGAAGAIHGSLATGAYSSTFTASQGLLLMIPNMYKLAGEEMPAVLHVAARALASHALSIFGDHSDVMSCRSTGFAMLASNSPQEIMDLASVAHLSAISGKVPMLHFFDGFRTSHEQQKIEVWDYDELKTMVDWEAIREFRKKANNPMHPHSQGSAEQPETFFQHREASNKNYHEIVEIVADNMKKVNDKIGSNYKPFNYYGKEDATEIIVAMGSVCETIEEVVDYLNGQGKKVGVVKVHLFRPFSPKHLVDVIPETVKSIAVMDRTKEPGSIGEPLYLDTLAALQDSIFEGAKISRGRYGLGSKDVQPGDIISVYENLWSPNTKKQFTISIEDDVTHLSLPVRDYIDTTPKGNISCKFWGLGADGTVGANKNSIKIIGDNTDKKVQAYFQYDSKKSGGITISHLRFGDQPIKSTYLIKQADFVACHKASYMNKYNIVQDVKPGGFFLLNCPWNDEELDEHLPGAVKKYIAKNDVQFYTCDAVELASGIGLGATRINTVLQAAFFKLANIIPIDEAIGYMKEAIKNSYGSKGEKIVNMNLQAVDAGVNHIHKVEIPASWIKAEDKRQEQSVEGRDENHTRYINEIMMPSNIMHGDSIPVSKFVDYSTGFLPAGTSAYEKRGIAVEIPRWSPDNCIQCNWCSYSCPHGVIRPFAMNEEEAEASGAKTIEMKSSPENLYSIAISALDCTGCGSCVSVCPARNKALVMVPAEEETEDAQRIFDYAVEHVTDKDIPFQKDSVKGSQFTKPLLEFSGACPGCGESPYAKLITQLYGDRMFIANATGCSSIWGCSAPSTPYTVNKEGRGPAWANSLFEDNAEFGLGMAISMKARRNQMKSVVTRLGEDPLFREAAQAWVNGMEDAKQAEAAGKTLLELCQDNINNDGAKYVVDNKDMLPKPSIWMFGGDGWAYDIGYGGLDHVIASNENVNILVFDTEVYSNTGGQASKSTPVGALAQFAASGKAKRKKNLAQMAIQYGYVYVAQIAMGANPEQTIKAIREAEAYNGPSLIIAYAPCINHGIKIGLNNAMVQMRNAVHAGYWDLLRYNPSLEKEGKNPLSIDCSVPSENFNDFIMGESRYSALALKFPERAKKLFDRAETLAGERREAIIKQKKSLEPSDVEEGKNV